MDILVSFAQFLINTVGNGLSLFYSLFPKSPFNFVLNNEFSVLISNINYFIPIYEFVIILESWIVAVGIYYVYSIFARWLKAIE